MNKLQFSNKKTLKLTNVLQCRIYFDEEGFDFNAAIEKMQSLIKVKGAIQIGPLIQHTKTYMNESNELDMEIVLMMQCNNYIHKLEEPYSMESVIRVQDCMYCRYTGPEEKMKFAYDKIGVEAFEANEHLADENYTIFLDRNFEDETITSDIFVPRATVI